MCEQHVKSVYFIINFFWLPHGCIGACGKRTEVGCVWAMSGILSWSCPSYAI